MSFLSEKDPAAVLKENLYPIADGHEVKAQWQKHTFVFTPENKCFLLEIYKILDESADAPHCFVEIGDPIIKDRAIFRHGPDGWQPIKSPGDFLSKILPGVQTALAS